MENDFHYHVIRCLMQKRVSKKEAEIIALVSQMVDECDAEIHGIQTQHKMVDAMNPTIQHTVIIPFHFVPGFGNQNPWVVTEPIFISNRLHIELYNILISSIHLVSIGILLHVFADMFSHQNFTGWNEHKNSCRNPLVPNIGHADKFTWPDRLNCTWYDPRSKIRVDNYLMFDKAVTFICRALDIKIDYGDFDDFKKIKTKEKRISWLKRYGKYTEDFEETRKKYWSKIKPDFVASARKHLSLVMDAVKSI